MVMILEKGGKVEFGEGTSLGVDHRMAWVGKDLKGHLIPPSTIPGCSEPLPPWPWVLPGILGQP